MSITVSDNSKFEITPRGLVVREPLTFDEWHLLAPQLGDAAKAVAFLIGDWLVYGRTHFAGEDGRPSRRSRVAPEEYEAAVRATGLDRSTLHTYAHVARRVDPTIRRETLSWEHHKVVAKLPPEEQKKWLTTAEGSGDRAHPISTRRLRRSIQSGRLIAKEEMQSPACERALDNHIPMVNRLVAWWAKMRARRWLDTADAEQRAALKRDLKPIVSIYEEL